MTLDFDLLKERLKHNLPGSAAHAPLRATPTGLVRPKFEHKSPPRPGSVLILLYPDHGQIRFPLTQRQDYPGAHGGQVSLPGGKAEPGEDYLTTALREAQEEIGVNKDDLTVIGRLTDFFVVPSNYLITPVVAVTKTKPMFRPDPVEVARILEGNLGDLLKSDAIQTKEIVAAKIYPMIAPHFEIEGEVVWGATAMMLNELRMVLQELQSTSK